MAHAAQALVGAELDRTCQFFLVLGAERGLPAREQAIAGSQQELIFLVG